MCRWFFMFMTILAVRGAKNYCSENVCNNSKQHTLCKYQSNQPASNCLSYKSLLNDKQDKLSVLHKINERRNKLASGDIRSFPSAENMLALEWNEELERSAQRWADQCVQHSSPDIKDTCRDMDDMSVGQNIATVFGDAPGLTPLALVDVWYTELLNINASIVARYRPSIEVSSSHYDYFTQLVWADTREVGCGAVTFITDVIVAPFSFFMTLLGQGSGIQKNKTVHRLVCNFAPVGNKIGESVYSDGVACSRCPNNSFCDADYKALCRLSMNSTSHLLSKKPDEDVIATSSDPNSFIHVQTMSFNFSDTTSDDIMTMFNYLSHNETFSRQQITSAPVSVASSCKDVLAVDELLELLKKKLSTDPIFKDVLSIKRDSETEGITDANVAAFVNRLYSKKGIPTTTTPQMNDNINSTLLTELVEAVIFRSADKQTTSETLDLLSLERIPVAPVKIQAELAQVKSNDYFTGHYFFPEDDSDDKVDSSNKEDDYDTNTDIIVSDVMSELQDLKKQLQTKDFVDEILESEVSTETIKLTRFVLPTSISIYNSGHNNIKKFLEEIGEKRVQSQTLKDCPNCDDKKILLD